MDRVVIVANTGAASTLLGVDCGSLEVRGWRIGEVEPPQEMSKIAEANFVVSRNGAVLVDLQEHQLVHTYVGYHGSDGNLALGDPKRLSLCAKVREFSHGADSLWVPHGRHLVEELKNKSQPSALDAHKSFEGLLLAFKDYEGRVRRAAVRFLEERVEVAYEYRQFSPDSWGGHFDIKNRNDTSHESMILLREISAIASEFLGPNWEAGLCSSLEEIVKEAQVVGITPEALLAPNSGFCKFRDELLGSDNGEVRGIALRVRDALKEKLRT